MLCYEFVYEKREGEKNMILDRLKCGILMAAQ